MTLSRWFRDYLYIPLGGDRAGHNRTYFNLILVFLVCGLWHGASWNFIIWGAYYGVFLIAERIGLRTLIERLPLVLQHGYLILVVLVGWVPFRSETLAQTTDFLSYMFIYQYGENSAFYTLSRFTNDYVFFTLFAAFLLAMPIKNLIKFDRWRPVNGPDGRNSSVMTALKTAALVALFGLSIIATGASSYSPFIYFRF